MRHKEIQHQQETAITIRSLSDETYRALRVQAAERNACAIDTLDLLMLRKAAGRDAGMACQGFGRWYYLEQSFYKLVSQPLRRATLQ